MTSVHYLKIDSCYFDAVVDRKKLFEIRFSDRGYSVGDFLYLREQVDGCYTGRSVLCEVLYILDDVKFLQPGYVCLSISVNKIEYNDTSTGN